MKNKYILITVGIAAGIAVLVMQQQRIERLSRQLPAQAPQRASARQLTEPRIEARAQNPEELSRLCSDNEELRRRLEQTEKTLDAATKKIAVLETKIQDLLRPTKEDILSSTLKATIGAGSSLLTGGYQTADGQYQFTSIRPRQVRLSDGRAVIELEARQFSVAPKTMNQLMLDDLISGAGNTIQHGILLKGDEWTNLMGKISGSDGAEILSAPKMTVLPGTQEHLSIGDYQMEATATLGADGSSVGLEMRIEQPRDPNNTSK